MKISSLIFDFDGVLAESVNIKSDAFYEIYLPYGKVIADKVLKHHLANGGMSRYEKFKLYHKKFLDILIDDKHLSDLVANFSQKVKRKVIASNEVFGTSEFFRNNNFDSWLVSATPEEELLEILQKRKMYNLFKKIYGSPRSKIDCVAEIIHHNKLNKSEVIFIGDAKTDYLAAIENSILFILRETQENFDFFKKISVPKIKDMSELESTILKI